MVRHGSPSVHATASRTYRHTASCHDIQSRMRPLESSDRTRVLWMSLLVLTTSIRSSKQVRRSPRMAGVPKMPEHFSAGRYEPLACHATAAALRVAGPSNRSECALNGSINQISACMRTAHDGGVAAHRPVQPNGRRLVYLTALAMRRVSM